MRDDAAIERLEELLGRVLFAGVMASAACLVAGLLLLLFNEAPVASNRLLNAGLIVLMATPILRVVVSLAQYLRMRDWFFVVTTAAVLMVLLASVVLALKQAT
jgi:uncharacterized membrane protein